MRKSMRRLGITAVAVCALLTMACSSSRPVTEPMENPLSAFPMNSGMASYAYGVANLEELEEHSDAIVVGKLRNDGREVKANEEPGGWAETVYTLDITQVFYGEFEPGDTLQLIEPYYVVDDESDGPYRQTEEPYLKTIEGYKPSMIGVEYLFFLDMDDYVPQDGRKNVWYGKYTPIHCDKGRYVYFTPEELEEAEKLWEIEVRKEEEEYIERRYEGAPERPPQEQIAQEVEDGVQWRMEAAEEARQRRISNPTLEDQVIDAYMSATPPQR